MFFFSSGQERERDVFLIGAMVGCGLGIFCLWCGLVGQLFFVCLPCPALDIDRTSVASIRPWPQSGKKINLSSHRMPPPAAMLLAAAVAISQQTRSDEGSHQGGRCFSVRLLQEIQRWAHHLLAPRLQRQLPPPVRRGERRHRHPRPSPPPPRVDGPVSGARREDAGVEGTAGVVDRSDAR